MKQLLLSLMLAPCMVQSAAAPGGDEQEQKDTWGAMQASLPDQEKVRAQRRRAEVIEKFNRQQEVERRRQAEHQAKPKTKKGVSAAQQEGRVARRVAPTQVAARAGQEERKEEDEKVREERKPRDYTDEGMRRLVGGHGIPKELGESIEKFAQPKLFEKSAQKKLNSIIISGLNERVMAISSDSTFIATGSMYGYVYIRDARTGGIVRRSKEVDRTGPIHKIILSENRQIVVTASGNHAHIWDANTLELLYTLRRHMSVITSIAIDPNSQFIVTGSADTTARVWDAHSGELLHTLAGHTNRITSVAISSNSQFIVTGSEDNTARVWSFAGVILHTLMDDAQREIYSIAISPNGQFIVTHGISNNTTHVWNADTGSLLYRVSPSVIDRTLSSTSVEAGQGYVWRMLIAGSLGGPAVISPNNQFFVAGFTGNGMRWNLFKGWNLSHGTLINNFYERNWIISSAVAISPDSQLVVTGLYNPSDPIETRFNKACVWNVNTGELVYTLTGHTTAIRFAVFSPDGQFIVTASDDSIRIWRAKPSLPIASHARKFVDIQPTIKPVIDRVGVLLERVNQMAYFPQYRLNAIQNYIEMLKGADPAGQGLAAFVDGISQAIEQEFEKGKAEHMRQSLVGSAADAAGMGVYFDE